MDLKFRWCPKKPKPYKIIFAKENSKNKRKKYLVKVWSSRWWEKPKKIKHLCNK
jgi:hypothetical protein